MAFNDQEVSTQDSRPVALYLLKWGATEWRYTSADRPIERQELVAGVMATVTYEPRALSDGGMVQGSSSMNDFTLDGPSDLPIVRLFRGTPPSETIWLTVRRMHMGSDDAPIYWKGIVQNVKRPSPARCQVIGQPLSASLKRTGLRLCWTRECPHFLYDAGCKVNPLDYEISAKVKALGGNSITVQLKDATHATAPVIADAWLRGGFVAWSASDEGTLERRFIEEQVGGVLTIFGVVDFLKVGDTVKMYPGCDRTPETCDEKFDNIDNYGGFDKMPGESPFNTAIW